jgi:FADH2 O2-dependent halogenase
LRRRYEIAVVGSGFAGSLFAMIAKRLGRSVVLIDRGRHPRVVIGESSTPLANLLWEELTTKYDLPELKSFAKWGNWQREHPEIACGLKRGFTFYAHDRARPRAGLPGRNEQLLVAASPNDEIADTHWYRADFDHFLVRQAEKMGVGYLDETDLAVTQRADGTVGFEGHRKGQEVSISAKFVVDASGPRGFLHRALRLREAPLPGYPATQALYSHFSGVSPLDRLWPAGSGERPPYPVDDAAVHHVFDGGWVWVLRFNNGVTSAGVAATDNVAAELDFSDGPGAWRRLLETMPVVRERFAGARAERDFTHIPRLSFRSAEMAGANWAMLPSAAGFVDPLLSTGFPLILLGVTRLAEIVERDWYSEQFAERLREYAAKTDGELLATARLIASLYANMNNFEVFSALSLLYFAAASYSETARRLSKKHLATSFLLHDHPVLGPVFADLMERASGLVSEEESARLVRDIATAIEPINVAGLADPRRGNWYPVEADDLFRSAVKLGATQEDISELLQRCGFYSEVLR